MWDIKFKIYSPLKPNKQEKKDQTKQQHIQF